MDPNGNGHFHDSHGKLMVVDDVVNELETFIDSDSQSFYRLVIGTDSQANKSNGES